MADGADGVRRVGRVGRAEGDSVRGAVGLRQVQDLRSAWGCGGTDGFAEGLYEPLFARSCCESTPLPVSCVCGVQVRLQPRRSLQGVTVTE